MKKTIIIILTALLIFLAVFILYILMQSESEKTITNYSDETIGQSCLGHADCSTPSSYMIRSNCPYVSLCIENTCQVVCPLRQHDQDVNVNSSYQVRCNQGSDCDCSQASSEYIDCRCIDNSCVAVVAKDPGQQEIPWSWAEDLLSTCRVTQVMQTHALVVTLHLTDGRIYKTTEPQIDEVFKILQGSGCKNVIMATE